MGSARQIGYSLLALIVLTMILGFAGLKLQENGSFKQGLLLAQQARQSQILEHIRSGLMGFAASQGLHSQSHLGHLPCPALMKGAHAQTSCLNKPWGYLPVHSKTGVNYLSAGIDARNNELELSVQQHWEYAVSVQLVQPNSLHWGRWVDYSQPAIQIRIPAENNRIENGIAAVVAKSVSPTTEHNYDITPPFVLVRVDELQAHMKRVQSHQIQDTLQTWQLLNPDYQQNLVGHENITSLNVETHQFQALDSGCKCRCTKTRCTCECKDTGYWVSPAPCSNSSENCMETPTQTRCTSKPAEPCVFTGPAGLQNLWPVSHFEPVAAANKSCRPLVRNQCPLSPNSNACTCHFSWPDNTKLQLKQFSFKLPTTP